jgi:hypothetical protein
MIDEGDCGAIGGMKIVEQLVEWKLAGETEAYKWDVQHPTCHSLPTMPDREHAYIQRRRNEKHKNSDKTKYHYITFIWIIFSYFKLQMLL